MPDLPDDLDRERAHWRAVKRERPEVIERPGRGQESVWAYPRPPRIEADPRELRVVLAGEVLAETRRGLRVLETSSPPVFYLPPDEVRVRCLVASERRSFCEWKGVAHYWHARIGGEHYPDLAWSYPEPDEGFEEIGGYLAFFPGRAAACFLDGERVRAQPGEFYGGWITREIVGPFKGDPGSEHW